SKGTTSTQAKLVVPFVFGSCDFIVTQRSGPKLVPARLEASVIRIHMIRVALVEPEIPPNTGNIARLCAATRVPLHIVGVTGFRLDDRAVRRAGLDYWSEVILRRHLTLKCLRQVLPGARFLYLTTKADRSYADWSFSSEDCLVFG